MRAFALFGSLSKYRSQRLAAHQILERYRRKACFKQIITRRQRFYSRINLKFTFGADLDLASDAYFSDSTFAVTGGREFDAGSRKTKAFCSFEIKFTSKI